MGSGEIDAQLDRILSSPIFAQSARLKSFLRYIVEAQREGRAGTVKEQTIGVDVFERGPDFDPRIDNVVRIQAGKLRSKLLEYYASEGANDAVTISIPKGSYIPKIQAREVAEPARAPVEKSRIAVLPFVNMSADPENEYFSDGLTEELINKLAAIPTLRVVARTSAFRFKGRNEDLREVGAKLNVGTVLEGSVRRAGSQLRVTAQLIDVENGFHLFSRTYQREYKDVFALQDELAQAVVNEIVPGNSPPVTRTLNLDAYNAYLRGMYALGSRFIDLRKCLDCFRESLSLAPDYAPAWAGLAHGHFLLAWFYMEPADTALALCREAALRTLSLDPESANGLSALAAVECAVEWNWESAEARFRRALELQPAVAVNYMLFPFCCLIPQRRLEDALDVLQRALAVDPFNPLLHAGVIDILGRVGRYQDAVRQHRLAASIAPDYAPANVALGLAHEFNGHLDEALAMYREACESSDGAPYPVSCFAHALAMAGRAPEARQWLEKLQRHPTHPVADYARVHVGLGELEKALQCLSSAVEQRSAYLLRVIADPRLAPLHSHPRFQALVEKMRLPVTPSSFRRLSPAN